MSKKSNKKNNRNNYKIESLEPRLMMDAAALQWHEEIKADFIDEVKNKTRKSFNTASSLKSLKNILKKAVVEARDSIALCAPAQQRRENSEFGQQHKASVATKLALS